MNGAQCLKIIILFPFSACLVAASAADCALIIVIAPSQVYMHHYNHINLNMVYCLKNAPFFDVPLLYHYINLILSIMCSI